MKRLKKVNKTNIVDLIMVAKILNACGKNMAIEDNLHHWDNPYIKSFAIVVLCSLKNDIFLLYKDNKPVATFMINVISDALHFEKLATYPSEAGRGVGSLCMKSIEKLAGKYNCNKIFMEVYANSTHAISFYKHRGYKIIGRMNSIKYQEVKMEKRLK